jgi:hypothetical protein
MQVPLPASAETNRLLGLADVGDRQAFETLFDCLRALTALGRGDV